MFTTGGEEALLLLVSQQDPQVSVVGDEVTALLQDGGLAGDHGAQLRRREERSLSSINMEQNKNVIHTGEEHILHKFFHNPNKAKQEGAIEHKLNVPGPTYDCWNYRWTRRPYL